MAKTMNEYLSIKGELSDFVNGWVIVEEEDLLDLFDRTCEDYNEGELTEAQYNDLCGWFDELY